MEEAYRASLFKSFVKTLEDGFFPVVIVDAIHDKVSFGYHGYFHLCFLNKLLIISSWCGVLI